MGPYNKPPEIANASIVSIVGTAAVTIVAAPGALLALRLVGGQLGVNRSAAGTSDTQLSSTGIVLARNFGLAGSLGGSNTIPLVIPYPGLLLAVNTSIILQIISSVAGISGVATVYYFTDPVS